MIKRIRFATRHGRVSEAAFPAAWRDAVAGAAQAPPGIRPSRVAVCTVLPGRTGAWAKHDGLGVEWFDDADHLGRFEGWLGTPDGRSSCRRADRVADPGTSPVVVADESVMRGAGWLERRWRDGGDRLKHLAIAVRADGLTPAEFSARWRDHAGRIGRPGTTGASGTSVIPEAARGLAYVQNHPRPRATGEWAYDALTEVYVDGIDGLRARIDWFGENLRGTGDDGLFRASWFLAVREQLVLP